MKLTNCNFICFTLLIYIYLFFNGILGSGFVYFVYLDNFKCSIKPGTPINKPIGIPRGYIPSRVVWSWNPNATTWNEKKDKHWWKPEYLNQSMVDEMLDLAIAKLSNTTLYSLNKGWDNLFRSLNIRFYGVNKGYNKGEKIAIKINLNGNCKDYGLFYHSQTAPQFLKSLARHLVDIVGVNQEDITFFEPSRLISRIYYDPPQGIGEKYPNINFVDNRGLMNYTKRVERDLNSSLIFGSKVIWDWDNTQIPKTVTRARYMIVVNSFRSHILAGVTLTGKNYFGTIYQQSANCMWCMGIKDIFHENVHWCPWNLHTSCFQYKQMGAYSPLVDLMGHPDLGGKGVLFIHDAIYAGRTQRSFPPIKYQMYPFNKDYMSSIFLSQDPVALDSVGFDFLNNEPETPFAREGCTTNYLREAALANNPPSKTKYKPGGKTLNSLGVYEHWNNAKDMKYSGNFGNPNGIELIKTFEIPSNRFYHTSKLKEHLDNKIFYTLFFMGLIILNFLFYSLLICICSIPCYLYPKRYYYDLPPYIIED
jgi:hypothetical protein